MVGFISPGPLLNLVLGYLAAMALVEPPLWSGADPTCGGGAKTEPAGGVGTAVSEPVCRAPPA